jgi:hypothetical protein
LWEYQRPGGTVPCLPPLTPSQAPQGSEKIYVENVYLNSSRFIPATKNRGTFDQIFCNLSKLPLKAFLNRYMAGLFTPSLPGKDDFGWVVMVFYPTLFSLLFFLLLPKEAFF